MIRLFVADRELVIGRDRLQGEADAAVAKMPKGLRFALRAFLPFVFDLLLNPALDEATAKGTFGAGWPHFVCPKGGEYLHEVAAYFLAMLEAMTTQERVAIVAVEREVDGHVVHDVTGLATTPAVEPAAADPPAAPAADRGEPVGLLDGVLVYDHPD